jgi:two-component system, LuxR family, response regulator FixJ
MCQPTLFLVEDDRAVRESLAWLLTQENYRVEAYSSPAELLAAYEPSKPGCLILDLHLPGMNGLQLRDQLLERGCEHPFIIITGHGDVPEATRAMRMGAVDFIEKPLPREVLLDRVREAVKFDAQQRRARQQQQQFQERYQSLSHREQEVLELVMDGKLTKQIADQLGISVKTVEVHRSNLTRKMGVSSVVQLVRLCAEQLAK